MNKRIVVVGSINADLADLNGRVDRHLDPGETLLATGGAITAGGKGANQAVAAALQGAEVAFIGVSGRQRNRTSHRSLRRWCSEPAGHHGLAFPRNQETWRTTKR